MTPEVGVDARRFDTDRIIDDVIEREGPYSNHPADRGGPTNWGITISDLSAWRNRRVSADDVRRLTKEEAAQIYRSWYIERPGFHKIANGPLRALLVDCGVNHGPADAVRWLQRAVGVKADGWIGPVTLGALERGDARRIYLAVCAARVRYYGLLISRDRSQAVFASGWMDRAADFVEEAP